MNSNKPKKIIDKTKYYYKYGFIFLNEEEFNKSIDSLENIEMLDDSFFIDIIKNSIKSGNLYGIFDRFASQYSVRDAFMYFKKIIVNEDLKLLYNDIELISKDSRVKELCDKIKCSIKQAASNTDKTKYNDKLLDNDFFNTIFETIYYMMKKQLKYI